MGDLRTLTLGEKRIRIDFNVSGLDSVNSVKRKKAELIDDLDAIRNTEVSKTYVNSVEAKEIVSGEKLRLLALAMTAYEEAAMWAVKAMTM
jgi:hypothetical protein